MEPKQLNVTVLGSGTSSGIPTVGCCCRVCTSTNPKNKRLRASILIEIQGTRIVIDCGPDFRHQALKYGIDDLNHVLLTHSHSDHTGGLDDLRAYYMIRKHGVHIYADDRTLDDLRIRYEYCFRPASAGTTVPNLTLNRVEYRKNFQILPQGEETALVDIVPIPLVHNGQPILGYRIGKFAYLTDVSKVPEGSLELLEGVTCMITTALRYRTHPSHMTVEEAVRFAEKVGASQTWFTHMNHEIDHDETNAALPENIRLAYDGLNIIVPF